MSAVFVYIEGEFQGKGTQAVMHDNVLDIEGFTTDYHAKYDVNFNASQHQVMKEFKKYLIGEDKFNKFQAVFWLLTTILQHPDSSLATAYKSLTEAEMEKVFEALSHWRPSYS